MRGPKRIIRVLGLAALWVAVLLLVVTAAGAYWVFTSVPDADGTMEAAGLEEAVGHPLGR